jgi:ELP3 family radical SAM enzyme/protein acetyltransferase
MDKILEDLEDFQLPNKVKDEITESKKIYQSIILQDLYFFCTQHQNIKNLDINNFKKLFTKKYLAKCRIAKVSIKKTDLVLEYNKQLENNLIKKCNLLEKMICKKPSRSISGINSITLVMSPYPNGQSFSCKHNCYYCPNEPAHKGNYYQAQPRSYLYHEPAVRRANRHSFKSYEQMIDRLDTLKGNGHPCDKIEIIIEGGTYNEFPIKYLEDFNRDFYYAANTYYSINKRNKLTLEEEVYLNRFSKVHIIGNCIETRPDTINENWIKHYRMCGVTRIQLGVQSTHNNILKKINRGHTIECALECIEKLKNLCFKIDIHIMPDLPYSTPELDKEMFDYTYNILQPDQIKIYPCAVVPWTIIEKWYNQNKWKPYEPEILKEVMDYAMIKCPEWIRLPRVIRDIPGVYIQAGNKTTNLRQMLVESKEIRSREIERHEEYYNLPAKIFINLYNNNNGIKDYFISYESYDKKALFGFIRLRLIKFSNTNNIYSSLLNKGLIRELHVYGFNTKVGEEAKASQHKGIGTKLLKTAEKITYYNNFKGISVISGEGVKEYYKKKGYYELETYMHKDFNLVYDIIKIINIMIVILLMIKFI